MFKLPEGWERKRVDELCRVTRGASPRPIHEWIAPAGTPWVKIADATSDPSKYITKTREFIRNEGRSKSVVVYPGDLILSNSATPGIPKFLGIEACIHDGWLLLRDLLDVDPMFLYYVFLNDRKDLAGQGNGSIFTNLKTDIVKSHKVTIPPMWEQRAIAEMLGALDDKVAANTKLVQTSAVLAQALFAASMRAAAHEVTLSDVAELLTRGVAPKYSDTEDTVVVLNQKCVRDQRVNLDPARRTLASKVGRDKMLKMNDVLVNSTGQGTLGRVARWTNSASVTVDSHITIVRFDQAKVDPVCAGMALLASQKTIEEMGEGSTGQTELSRIELGKLSLRLPHKSRQAELSERITSMSEMESVRLSENRTLSATRDALLPQLMSGKLRVKDAERVLENAGV
ncbi:restriction endonuclease subunit S [Arthrobacter sp. 135MFCol5.1]|uniref:restriction endonuclease subunit S n=1 Tax=Arthrobacter sp. 135MFCol5.1 TaxID=1158050 RepID=UPI0009D9974D|nr:restriction endonuclease subunit S [Arthrobacter sp. 135MFCol5.1]